MGIETKAEPTREAKLHRILDLKRMYRLGWLVRQETFNEGGLNALDDAALMRLLRILERATQCPVDDVAYEDAGLIRSRAGEA